MNLTNTKKLITATLCLAASYSYADSDRPLFSLTMTESGVPQTNNDGSLAHSVKSESRILPIWGDAARAKGYDLPEPFGASYSYMNMRQDIVVDSIKFQFTNSEFKPWESAITINAGDTRQKSETHLLKLDSWIFPFLNVYGVYGKTKGTSKSNLDSIYLPGTEPGKPAWDNLPFELNFKGKTFGGGATFAGGYNQFFATLDANYTRTNLDILDGDISAFVLTPRIGYEFVFNPLISGQGNTKVQVWVGAMYQDITQRFKGDVSKLDLPPELSLFDLIKDQTDIKFDVKQHLAHKWNNTVGARFEVTRNFNITSEVGFGNRNTFFVSGEFRF
ncbi:hypothetical protein HZS38_18910 [Xenorhabdus nematophila]|uniref:Porin n=1 Tax=Xenorhabdus nematophila (strain ATCC 19061 / DSM 3370 / CCUG 14189 / LMG 1036 / NCIMB 9965 / AN6) TaxID=406817 RepID=D3VAY3_XENNA|nr:hypothetical protein [Xenorhabdus nematophila]CEF28692.1 conserved hypothetical protein; putative exported protein [Xenorhabdus nematophila str. Websteri]AYA42369.1 hypothetical protein D3790_19675 [Xenorhabdus nematophila]MBA0021103.1 hypothetical protein [Xenorhabdus nematophila]MCB4425213.1 hypothetical protein [Xenorhabdus nematophila]QNJ36739.1 hypothetical protein H8F46_19260 [Xenorhabdus nematophila]